MSLRSADEISRAENKPIEKLTEHNFGEWSVIDEPEVFKDGKKSRNCEECGLTETETIPGAVCSKDEKCPMHVFGDLKLISWYHDGIHFCIVNGLMNGTSAGTFAPSVTTNRAMVVTILWRLEGRPAVTEPMSFEDVPAGKWYTEAVRWAQANKIVTGYSDKEFGPDDDISREQLATILYRYEQYKGGGLAEGENVDMDYADMDKVAGWSYEAMCWMKKNGIVTGKPGNLLDPKGSASRAETATMLFRYSNVSADSADN